MKFKKNQRVVADLSCWDGGGPGTIIGIERIYIVKMDSGPTFRVEEAKIKKPNST